MYLRVLLLLIVLGCLPRESLSQRFSVPLTKPVLRQADTLEMDDIAWFPIWVQSRSLDHNEPWYDDTDEDTYRPWFGSLPVDPSVANFLVRATFVLADGKRKAGLVSPSYTAEIQTMRPIIFGVRNEIVSFWLGTSPPENYLADSYRALRRRPADVFPIRFEIEPGITLGVLSGTLEGFYSIRGDSTIVVEK